jgi:hypothetical protein
MQVSSISAIKIMPSYLLIFHLKVKCELVNQRNAQSNVLITKQSRDVRRDANICSETQTSA